VLAHTSEAALVAITRLSLESHRAAGHPLSLL